MGQMPNAMVGQMNQMQMIMQGGGQMGSINNMNMPMTIGSNNQINASNLNQPINPGQQINPNQMTQMLNRINSINSVQGIVGPNAPNAGNQMNQPQLVSDLRICDIKFLR